MKELTIEQKARAYDKAVERIREKIYPSDGPEISGVIKGFLENIFPELKESEDEKIRKALLQTLQNRDKYCISDTFGEVNVKDAISWLEKQGEKSNPYSGVSFEYNGHTWGMCARDYGVDILLDKQFFKHLEKQGEQKSADKVEPRFKVGDWVVQENIGVYKIIEICESWYEVIDSKDNRYSISFDNEHMCHLWTIKDAKEGDVLATNNDGVCIFDGTVEEGKYPFAYCGVTERGFEFYDGKLPFTHTNVQPATKEQRDLLFQKMKEAGYEWDGEKRELRKIEHEQNPADKSDVKFKGGDCIVNSKGETAYITEVGSDFYGTLRYYIEWTNGNKSDPTLCFVDNDFHLWTIKDAKDGDVLVASDGSIFLFAGVDDCACKYYAVLTNDNNIKINKELKGGYWETSRAVHPATKEQRESLFQKMNNAGYEWDSEKKELKKITTKYIDLDLPSGTLWSDTNEEGLYTFSEAVIKYGNSLPTKEQWEELKDYCKWEWNGSEYKVTGSNGNNIVLPAEGYRNGDGDVDDVGSYGIYWSSKPDGPVDAWRLSFNSCGAGIYECYRRNGVSIRLVKNKDNNMKYEEINIAEKLKNCPEGTKLYSVVHGECEYDGIEPGEEYPIRILFTNGYGDVNDVLFTEDGRFEKGCGECILFPSKDNRDWDTFNVRQNFKKGDIVTRVYDDVNSTILLMDETDWSSKTNPVRYICYVDVYGSDFHVSQSTNCCWCYVNAFYADDRYRLATDDEKKKLLDAIDKHGYVWDSEKLELHKKEEKPEFKKGDIITRVHDNSAPCILMMGDTDWSSQDNPVRFICYKDLNKGGGFNVSKPNDYWCSVGEFDFSRCRPATNLEKHWLMKNMNKHGYVWDEEHLELRKKEHEFKPYERVLARNEDSDLWMPVTFGFKHEKWYGTSAGYFLQCIPYKGNENLGGTAQKPE